MGNINQLRNKYVDIFGTKDEDTVEGYWTYDETFTGGVTPAATSSDKPYRLFLKYSDKQQTIIGGHEFYKGNKPVLTLKELDFRIRQTLIKNKKLYNGEFNKGQIKITVDGNNYTIDLSKKLKLTDTNRYVKNLKMHKLKSYSKNLTNLLPFVNADNFNYLINPFYN